MYYIKAHLKISSKQVTCWMLSLLTHRITRIVVQCNRWTTSLPRQYCLPWGGVILRADTDGSCGKVEFSSVGSCKQTHVTQWSSPELNGINAIFFPPYF